MDGKRIFETRKRLALTQTELADKVGVSQPLVSLWEKGKAIPSEEQRKKLSEVLGEDSGDAVTDTSTLAAWLSKARNAKQLSLPELAHRSGVSAPAIYRIEQGVTRNIQRATRKKLERVLGAMPAELLSEVVSESTVKGLGTFEGFDPHFDSERPTGPGIYVLYDISERPIYVGESADVKRRIKEHEEKFWFKRPIIESAAWIRVEDDQLRRQIEELLIKFLKSNAVINKQHSANSRSGRQTNGE